MWADSLLALERGHVLRLSIWGAACVIIGLLLVAVFWRRRASTPLLWHFALQTASWGAIELGLSLWGSRHLAFRDFAAAQQLVNFLWLNTGLDAGYIMLGATLALASWRMGPRPGGIGAGAGIIVQGLALLVLDVRLITLIGSFQ